MHIEGHIVRLRAVEPSDIDRIYLWENDASIWAVSGTLVPFSRHTLQRFLDEQAYDLLQTRQQRLIIEVPAAADEPASAAAHPLDRAAECAEPAARTVGETGCAEPAARAMAEPLTGRAVGALDLFELDMLHRRVGVGILIHAEADRSRGYAKDAVETFCRYAREVLGLHQVWCNVGAANEASLRLFAACGFREAGRKRDWLRTAEGWQDELLLQRIL